MARYLVKVKGHKIDYMLIPKGMTVKQLEKRREQHKGTNIGSLRDYSLVRAENMTEAINTLLHKQRRIAPTERVRFKKIAQAFVDNLDSQAHTVHYIMDKAHRPFYGKLDNTATLSSLLKNVLSATNI